MSADLLREAAALIRKRAEAATPGPWTFQGAPDGFPPVVIANNLIVADTYDKPHLSDAEHIASWHPAVALAVADSIDGFLGMHWIKESSRWSDRHQDEGHYEDAPRCTDSCVEEYRLCNGCGTRECHEIGYWLPVARAYLGREA